MAEAEPIAAVELVDGDVGGIGRQTKTLAVCGQHATPKADMSAGRLLRVLRRHRASRGAQGDPVFGAALRLAARMTGTGRRS
jgi:hypothetical protein